MKLHTVFITHNRLHLTKRAIESYLETVTAEKYVIWVVDNGSTDGTQEWLPQVFNKANVGDRGISLFRENMYPGRACNEGWEMSEHAHWSEPPDFLHRADNDFVFLPGWCDEVARMFSEHKLGQLGMRTDEEELFAKSNVGGNNLIRRELWDKGLRYDERPWPQIRDEVSPGHSEDSLLSPAVKKMGYTWDRVEKPCIVNIDEKDADDPYYIQSFGDRGIDWKAYR